MPKIKVIIPAYNEQDSIASVIKDIPEIVDDFPDKIYPIEHNLQLKVGAQIIFVKTLMTLFIALNKFFRNIWW